MGEQRKLIEQDQREDGKSAETKEEKKESEEDKHLNEPDIDDLLGRYFLSSISCVGWTRTS